MSLLFGRHRGFYPLNIFWQLYMIIVIHLVHVYVDGIVYANCNASKSSSNTIHRTVLNLEVVLVMLIKLHINIIL